MEEEKKIGFFTRLKKAIFNVEDYNFFVSEGFGKAFKYIMILIAIETIILSITTTIKFRQEFDKLIDYVKNEFPDFSYDDGNFEVEGDYTEAYDEEYEASLVVDTSDEVSEETLEEYKEKAELGYYSVVILKDKMYYKMDSYEYTEIEYSELLDGLDIDSTTKDELFENYLNDDGIIKITIVIFIYSIIYVFVSNFLVLLEDILILGIVGWIVCKLCRVTLNFVQNFTLAVYSITLSLILSIIYSVAYNFTGFEIKYFTLMYMIIAYIYIIAAIMLIKSAPDKTVRTRGSSKR